MPAPQLSIVVPVYDEEQVLERTLPAMVRYAERLGRSFELVCVDDGSNDRSAEILARAAARDARMRVESHAHNRGKGAAVRTGVMAARGDLIFFLDADLSTPLEEMQGFIAALESGHDVAIGNRRARGSRITRRQPWIRERLGRGFTLLTCFLLAPGIDDFTCGFKGFRRDAARRVFERASLPGWAFDAEVVVAAREQGLSIAQIPVSWRHEDDSKVRLLPAVLASLRDMWIIYRRRRAGRYR
jgi:dolichyl-phosphate beta-glucosyltransferase